MSVIKRWFKHAYHQLTWGEVSGSVGDLGTFLPLLIGLVQKVDLDLGTTLIVTGAYNVISGLQFGIPMCVQPMKTIAAVALASVQPSLTLTQLLLAGVFVSGCVLLLGASRLVDLFNWLVPPPVVRGVQLAVGAKLAMKGVDMALRVHVAGSGPGSGSVVQWRPWLGSEGLLVGATALALLVASTIAPRVSAPGSPGAAEDGGLGPRPTDTPFEPLLARLLPGQDRQEGHAGASDGAVAAAAVRGAAAGSMVQVSERSGGSGSCVEVEGGGEVAGSETSRLLGGGGAETGREDDPEAAQGPSALSSSAAAGTAAADGAAIAKGKMDGSWNCITGGGGSSIRQAAGAWGCGGGGDGCHGGGGSGGGGVRRRQFPSALVAVLIGLVLAVASQPAILSGLRLGPTVPRLLHPTWRDFREGALRAGLPQLPLTTLNSIIAVTQLADSLFPERRDSARWRPSAVALSVALLNLGGCWVGAMPCCHGAGGLAAQYKFGARTGAAPVLLGCLKAGLGLLFGGSLMALLQHFPQPLLGALLVVSGVELGSAIRHTRTLRGYTFALLTAVAILGLDNTGTGFLLGLAAVAFVAAYEAVAGWLGRCHPRVAAGWGRSREGHGRPGADVDDDG